MSAQKKDAPRYNVVNTRLSDEELAESLADMQARGMKMTEYVRLALAKLRGE